MYSLPDSLALRFKFYLNILPTFEDIIMYLFLISGVALVLVSFYRLYQMKSRIHVKNRIGTQWLDEDFNDKPLDFLRIENRKDMTSKELEVYYSSLITPINQDLSFQEFSELREDIVWRRWRDRCDSCDIIVN